jgi:hypothetical protein
MKNCHLIDTNNNWCFRVVEVRLFTGTYFLFFLSPSSFYYAGNPYSSFLRIWRQYISSSLHIRISTTMSLPPPPSAPGGGGMPGHSGRRGNAGAAARAAAARRKEDRANVLLARTNKTQPATPSNRKIQHQNRSDEILPINELIVVRGYCCD